jgi:hypothetical protein
MELLFNPEKPLVWVKLSTNGRQQFIARTTTEGEFSVLDGAGGSVTYKNIEGDAVPLNKVPTDSVRPRNSNESEPLSPEIRAELLQNPADFVSNNPNNIYSIAHKQYELSYQKAEYSGQEGTEVTLVRGRRYRESYFFKQGEAIPSPEELRTFDSTRVSTVDLLAAGRIEVEGGNGLHPPVTAERLRNDPDLIYREGYSKITVHSPFSGSLEITPSENGVRYSYQSYQQWDGNRSYSEKEFLKLIVGTDPVDVVWKEGDKSVYIKGAFSKSELAAPNFFATHPQIQEVRFDERDSGTLTRIVISRKESLDWQNEANVMTYSYKSVTEDVPFARGNSPWTTSSVVTTKRDGTVEISNGAEDPKAVLKDLPNLFQNQEIDAVRVAMPTGVNETVQIEVKRHDRQLATSEGMLVDGVDSQGERIRLFLSKGTPTYLCDASGISNAVSPPTKKLLTDEMFHPDTALKEYNEYTIKNPLNEFNVIRVTKLPNNQYSVSVSKVVAQELQTETKIYSLGSGQDLRNLVDLPQL